MFDSIPASYWLFGAFTLIVAYVVRGIAGFGSRPDRYPLLALILPLTVVVPLVVFLITSPPPVMD